MPKQERREDINNRYTLAIAERDAFAGKGSNNYNILSAVAKNILTECENGKHPRHGFRLSGTRYHEVILLQDEAV